jgi:hypothetical protein
MTGVGGGLAEAEDNREQSGGTRVKQELVEESKSNFKKFNPKSLTNSARNMVKEEDNQR